MTEIKSPLPGKIMEIKVAVGDKVIAGQELIIIESMKMEIPILSTADGTVRSINAKVNEAMQGESVLVELE